MEMRVMTIGLSPRSASAGASPAIAMIDEMEKRADAKLTSARFA